MPIFERFTWLLAMMNAERKLGGRDEALPHKAAEPQTDQPASEPRV